MGVLCGVDIVEIDRIQKSFEVCGDSFRSKVFTEKEIEYCESKKAAKYQSYAARFAAKEAVSKAFGTGIGERLNWKEIEISNNESGKPFVILSGKANKLFDEINGAGISLSLSHCKNYAVAYVVIETND
jgi:holo-[acyl-carrier protein] synthase